MLSDPSQPEPHAVELVVLPADKPVRRGRPVRLTLKRFVKICRRVEAGWAVTTACEAESVTYQIFRFRCSKNPRLEERFRKAERIRAEVRHERALASVMEAGEKSWLAYAWFLERCWPHLYALRSVNRVDPEQEKELEAEIPAEVLARHRALLLELAHEDEAKQPI
jgi:hypothetical protein